MIFFTYISLAVLTLFSICCSVVGDLVVTTGTSALTADSPTEFGEKDLSQLDVLVTSTTVREESDLQTIQSHVDTTVVSTGADEGSGSESNVDDRTTSTGVIETYLTEDSLIPTSVVARHPSTLMSRPTESSPKTTTDFEVIVTVVSDSVSNVTDSSRPRPVMDNTAVEHNFTTSPSVTVVTQHSKKKEDSVESTPSTVATEFSTTAVSEESSSSEETSSSDETLVGSNTEPVVSNVAEVAVSSTLPTMGDNTIAGASTTTAKTAPSTDAAGQSRPDEKSEVTTADDNNEVNSSRVSSTTITLSSSNVTEQTSTNSSTDTAVPSRPHDNSDATTDDVNETSSSTLSFTTANSSSRVTEQTSTSSSTDTEGLSRTDDNLEVTTDGNDDTETSSSTVSPTATHGATRVTEQTSTSSMPVASTLEQPVVTGVSVPEPRSTLAIDTTQSHIEVTESNMMTQGLSKSPVDIQTSSRAVAVTTFTESTLLPSTSTGPQQITDLNTTQDTTSQSTNTGHFNATTNTWSPKVTTVSTSVLNSTVETETSTASTTNSSASFQTDYANFTEDVATIISSIAITTQDSRTLTDATELTIMKDVKSYDNLTELEFFNSVTVIFRKLPGTKETMYFNQDAFKKVVICLLNVYEYEGWPSEAINETFCDYKKSENQSWALDDSFAPLKPNDLVIVYPSPKNDDDKEIVIVSFFVKNSTSKVSGRIIARNHTLNALGRHQELLSNQMNMDVAEIYARIPVALLVTQNSGDQQLHASTMSHSLLLVILLAVASICIMIIMIGLVCIKCRAQSGHWEKETSHDKTQLQNDAMRSEMGAHHLNSDEDIRKDENAQLGWRNGSRNGNGYLQGNSRNGNRRQNGNDSSPTTTTTMIPISDNETWVDVPFTQMTPDERALPEMLDTKL